MYGKIEAPVRFTFIEEEADRHAELCSRVSEWKRTNCNAFKLQIDLPINGDCATTLDLELNRLKPGEKFGPAFVFLDQFGFSSVPLSLIRRVMQQPVCEVFVYMNWTGINRFMTDPNKASALTAAFGSERWREAQTMPQVQRELFIRKLYVEALKTQAGVEFVWPFTMNNEKDQPLYWLFFGTQNLTGLKVMKRAMWQVDGTGAFAFSDRQGLQQMTLLKSYDAGTLAHDMENQLADRILTAAEVERWVLTETPAYLFKDALQLLEGKKSLRVLNPTPGRKSGSYPDDELASIKLQFASAPMFN